LITVFKRGLYWTLSWARRIHMIFEIFRAVNINTSVFWDVGCVISQKTAVLDKFSLPSHAPFL
jgi:hypothetical protein